MSFEGAQYKFLHVACAAVTDDTVVLVPIPQNCTIKSAKVVSEAGVAANDTNYLITKVTNLGTAGDGTTILVEHDTRAAHENALVAKVSENMNLNATAANLKVAAGSTLEFSFIEEGTITAGATICLGYVLR